MLVRHGHWIGHAEFVARFAWVQACPEPGAVAVAGIDWQAAAGGLDGGGLDHVNIALVARAVLHANGNAGATVTVPVPPRFPPGIDVAGAGGTVRRGEGR